MMKYKLLLTTLCTVAFLTLGAMGTFAHVVVQPSQVGVGAFQTFTIGVPNEKEIPVVGLRLVVPEGVSSVSPNVKPGWKIDVKKNGAGDDAIVTEIDWTGGSIPLGQRDDFLFSAQVPAKEVTLNWKAYQTYKNGTVVSWDQNPDPNMSDDQREAMEKKNMGQYSQTKIINDLTQNFAPTSIPLDTQTAIKQDTVVAYAALALSVVALGVSFAKKKK